MIKTTWLIFSQGQAWWAKCLKRNFGHMDVLNFDGKRWILTRISYNTLVNEIYEFKDYPFLNRDLAQKHRVIELTVDVPKTKTKFPQFGILTCTTLIKYLSGIKLRCMTPWGLYKKLVRMDLLTRHKHGIVSIINLGVANGCAP